VNSFKIQLLRGKKNFEIEVIDYILHNRGKSYVKEDIDFILEGRK